MPTTTSPSKAPSDRPAVPGTTVRTVIFDMNDVLVGSESVWFSLQPRFFAEYGLDVAPEEKRRACAHQPNKLVGDPAPKRFATCPEDADKSSRKSSRGCPICPSPRGSGVPCGSSADDPGAGRHSASGGSLPGDGGRRGRPGCRTGRSPGLCRLAGYKCRIGRNPPGDAEGLPWRRRSRRMVPHDLKSAPGASAGRPSPISGPQVGTSTHQGELPPSCARRAREPCGKPSPSSRPFAGACRS